MKPLDRSLPNPGHLCQDQTKEDHTATLEVEDNATSSFMKKELIKTLPKIH